ncbi:MULTISPECIES: glycosyltransferase family 2 protein [Bacteroidales]|uniref:glycosyltransferase family 2 protein n=1 Tax=Bacteroidales TaxID=171549 RepID=UPI00255815EB|nr:MULTISPECIES: glycosyltransferase family 2 protein [Bacteroidales]
MKISIITATYNSAETIGDTIESVLSQSYQDFEHIIIDGQSKDNTVAICRSYSGRYNGRLKIVSEKDRGIYDAMNKGILLATGDIVGILNSDDFYSRENVLVTIANEFSRNNIDAVYGDIHFVNPSDLTKCVRYYSSRFFHKWMMVFGYQPAHPSFYCRRECYEKYGYFDISYKIAADFENLLRLIYLHKIRIHYIPMDFVTMRQGGASTNGLASHKRIFWDHYRAYKKNCVPFGYFCDIMRYPLKFVELLMYKVFPKAYSCNQNVER